MPFRRSLALLLASSAACTLLTDVDGLTGGNAGTDDGGNDGSSADNRTADGAQDTHSDGTTADADAGPAPPIEFIQATATGANPLVPSVNLPFAANVLAHDAIVVAVTLDSTSTLAKITDSLGNTYARVVGPLSASGKGLSIWAALDSPAGPCTLTFTSNVGQSTPNGLFYIHEYAGLALSSAFDVGASRQGSSAGVDGIRSGPATTSFAHELVFAFAETNVAVFGTGFDLRSKFADNVTEDRIVASTGSYEATATMTSGTGWGIVMATFKGR